MVCILLWCLAIYMYLTAGGRKRTNRCYKCLFFLCCLYISVKTYIARVQPHTHTHTHTHTPQARAPKSPILIVGTHLDKVPPQKIKPFTDRFKKRIKELYDTVGYPHISGIMMVSCVTQEGIRELTERIHYAAVNAVDPDTREHIIGMQVC